MYVRTYVCMYVRTYVRTYKPRGSSMLKIGVESNRRWMCKLALDLSKVHNYVQIWTVAGVRFGYMASEFVLIGVGHQRWMWLEVDASQNLRSTASWDNSWQVP
jgi:hypothetical protein